jgi:hypothetical protein
LIAELIMNCQPQVGKGGTVTDTHTKGSEAIQTEDCSLAFKNFNG